MKRFASAATALVMLSSPAFAQAAMAEAEASAAMINADGDDVGTVTFRQTASGILHVFVEMTDLSPGAHGLHIHENGACDPEGGFESAGGHFTAGDEDHGIHSPDGPHSGDLPNVHVGQDGILKAELFTERTSLDEGAENGLLGGDGRAVILHSEPDDYATDPHGDAGDRIACGVIEAL